MHKHCYIFLMGEDFNPEITQSVSNFFSKVKQRNK